jgi:hypothetical protein
MCASVTLSDIDAKFGKLWTHFRNGMVLTPQDMKDVLEDCFGNKSLPFDTVDLFAIPNFQTLFPSRVNYPVTK